MKFTLIVPMYNEIRIIRDTAKTLSDYMASHFSDYEILFSNDGSTDGCDAAVKQMNLPHVRVVGYLVNRGKGCAVRTAVMESTGDLIMFTDADLAYGTDVIGRVAGLFGEHTEVDLIIGSRNLDKDGYAGYTFLRKVASKAYIKVLCLTGGFRLSDSQCGCKAFRGEVAKQIFSRCEVDGFAFDFEAILWSQKYGKQFLEMPVQVINHRASKVHVLRDTFRMLRDLHRMKKRIRNANI